MTTIVDASMFGSAPLHPARRAATPVRGIPLPACETPAMVQQADSALRATRNSSSAVQRQCDLYLKTLQSIESEVLGAARGLQSAVALSSELQRQVTRPSEKGA